MALKVRQATHVNCTEILGSCLEPPGGMNCPPGDVSYVTQFLDFLYDLLGSDEHPLSDASKIGSI